MSNKLDDFLEKNLEENLVEAESSEQADFLQKRQRNKTGRDKKDNENKNPEKNSPEKPEKEGKQTARHPLGSLWLIVALVLWLLQLVTTVAVAVMLCRLNMLPGVYLAAIIAALIFLLLLDFVLLYWIDFNSNGKKNPVLRRIVGTVLAILAIAGSLFAASVLDKLMTTMNIVTAINNVEQVNICVYVLADDPAESIEDTGDYVFGITEAYDYEHTQDTITSIENSLGHSIETETYDSAFSMIDALYNQEVDAIILNKAYESIITDVEDYSTFDYDTKVLHYIALDLTVEARDNGEKEDDGVFNITEDSFVVYISGSDTRDSTLTTSRSDVNILVVVNPSTRQILLLSTPRDYYVPISIGNGENDKLTHCGVYGTQCSMDTLSNLYNGLDIRYYAQINFTGFETLIDAIGGVTVYNEEDIDIGQYHFDKGNVDMSGAEALAFVRERYQYSDGDRARGRHQMAVLKAIFQKIIGSTTLITNYTEIMDSLEGMFTTNVSTEEISELIKMQLSDMTTAWTIAPVSVTGSDSTSTECYSSPGESLYVMIPDQNTVDTAIEEIQKVFDGEELR